MLLGRSRMERVRVTGIGEAAAGGFALSGLHDPQQPPPGRRPARPRLSHGRDDAGRPLPSVAQRDRDRIRRELGRDVGRYNEPIAGSFTLELENSIAQGGAGPAHRSQHRRNGEHRRHATPTSTPRNRSAKRRVIDGGGNQTAPPLFVDAENGDYREAAGSPTIDAGVAGELGAARPRRQPAGARLRPRHRRLRVRPAPAPRRPLTSLTLSPASFRPRKAAAARSPAQEKKQAPVGSTVSYSLSAAAAVNFTVERATRVARSARMREADRRPTTGKKKCARHKPLKGGFTVTGRRRAEQLQVLRPDRRQGAEARRYRLVGSAGGAIRARRLQDRQELTAQNS